MVATGLRITSTHTPSSSSDTGTQGQFAVDENYLYYCYATDSWTRVAMSTWQIGTPSALTIPLVIPATFGGA
jgi:hypothetical protein